MNEKLKHTPGPWTVGTSSNNGIHCVDAIDPHRPGIIEICEVWGTYLDTEKDEMSLANACLIASAPELLEALLEIDARLLRCSALGLSAADAYDSFYQEIANGAISLATGKTSEAA